MLKDKIDTLNFFKDLVYMNIDQLHDDEKAQLWRSIKDVGSQLLIETRIKPIKRGKTYTDEKLSTPDELALKNTVLWFRTKFDEIVTTITEERARATDWMPWSGNKTIFFIEYLPFERSVTNIDVAATIFIEPEDKIENNEIYTRWPQDWREKSPIRINARLDVKNGLLLGFLKAINGLTPDTFRLCPACKQWYFHLSKRSDRKYCSDKCTRREQVRRHRKKKKASPKKKKARPK